MKKDIFSFFDFDSEILCLYMNFCLKDILLEVLKNNFDLEILEKLSDEDWDNLISLSNKQLVNSIIYYNFKKQNLAYLIPDRILADLDFYHDNLAMNNLLFKSELVKLLNEFNKLEVPLIILKGLHLAFLIYPQEGLRFMNDLDILIPIDKIKEAVKISKKLYYKTEKEIIDSDIQLKYTIHLPKMMKKHLVLEIHGFITDPRKDYSFPNELLWENSVKEKILGQDVLVLDELDLIIHLCIHISYQDLFALDLRHYYDIYLIFKNKSIDFDKLILRIKELKLQKGCYLVFLIIEDLFHYKFPETIHNSFKQNNNDYEAFIKTAIDLMWMYDKSSEDYINYRKAIYVKHSQYFEGNILDKLKLAFKQLFVPKLTISIKYQIPINSKVIYFYYLIRLKDLLLVYLPELKKTNNSDKIYKEQLSISKWLFSK